MPMKALASVFSWIYKKLHTKKPPTVQAVDSIVIT